MDIDTQCPAVETAHFLLRLLREEDSEDLFVCYHDPLAAARMNDDNCDFGFCMETREQMAQTVAYWLDFYRKGCFVRFAVVDKATGRAVGTMEGFGGDVGVLRVDIASAYERADLLAELFAFGRAHFREFFGNEALVTKAAPKDKERRAALAQGGWEWIDTFRGYRDYYRIAL